MKDIAPDIFRQRLIIEGYYSVEADREMIEKFLNGLAEHLRLTTYGAAAIFSPAGAGKDENQGFDAFIPLIDSGISVYIWARKSFFSVLLYTCREFDVNSAVDFTSDFFQVQSEIVYQSF